MLACCKHTSEEARRPCFSESLSDFRVGRQAPGLVLAIRGITILGNLASLVLGTLGHPRTEREERYSGEMWRRARRAALGSGADVRVAYAAHGAELYWFALRSLGDAGLAEEAVQDTFVRAWRAADRHDPRRGSLRT